MKSFAALSVFASVALAQSTNPLIPTGISPNCTTFLQTLNSDASLAACTKPLIDATAQYGPAANASGTPSAATISSTLSTLCASSSACPDNALRTQLGNFYSACQAELTSAQNADVVRTYDVVYVLTPLKQAVCAKDESGNYCVANTSAYAGGSAARLADVGATNSTHNLYSTVGGPAKRDTAQVALIPNVTTYRQSNLLFLFLEPSLPSTELCTSCTRTVVNAYTSFETTVPYAPGLGNSPLLAGQPDLYNGVLSTCGASFFSGSVQAAGGLGGGITGNTGAAPRSADGPIAFIGSVLAALAVGLTTAL